MKGKKSDAYIDNAKRMMGIHVYPKLENIKCDMIDADVAEVVLNDYLHGNNLQHSSKKHNLGPKFLINRSKSPLIYKGLCSISAVRILTTPL